MPVVEITSKPQFETILKRNKIVILDVYATWCGPCKQLAPQLEKLSNEYAHPHVAFVKENNELGLHKVEGLPSIFYFINGQQVDTTLGADFSEITAKVQKCFRSLRLTPRSSQENGREPSYIQRRDAMHQMEQRAEPPPPTQQQFTLNPSHSGNSKTRVGKYASFSSYSQQFESSQPPLDSVQQSGNVRELRRM